MNVLIYLFSGTGNTKKICDEYVSRLVELGHNVTVRTLPLADKEAAADALAFDLIGIGYPIHAFNAPRTVLDLCKAMPNQGKTDGSKRVFVFKSSGEPVRMSDVSSLKMRAMLKRRGYCVTNEYQYVMPYNIIFRHSDGAAYKMWQTAKQLVAADVAEIANGKESLPEKMFAGGFLAWLLRVEHWGAHIIGRFFKTNKDCVNCGLCIKTCPVRNIKLTEKGKIKFGGKCIICMRCSFTCPKNAVELGILKKWKVNGAYSFEPPTEKEPPSKHDDYCKKAYDRYYAAAQTKISEYNKNGRLT